MSADPAVALVERLQHGAGAELLAGLPPYDEGTSLSLMTRLRDAGHDPDLVSAALTQARLRSRARPRLGDLVDRLLLTQDGVEQATRPPVAARRATLLASSGVEHVVDLGCGLGLDSMAFAQAGLAVTAVEADPAVAAAARANLAPFDRVRVLVGDAHDTDVGAADAAFLDPARRVPGHADTRGRTRRLTRLEDLSPPFETVLAVAQQARVTAAKLSPAFPRAAVPHDAAAEWVGIDGDVLECTLWWGLGPPGRRAVVGTTTDGEVSWHEVRSGPHPGVLAPGADPGPWLAEPDRTVLAADLTGAVAALVQGQELSDDAGYVSAEHRVENPVVRWYAVREVLPLRARTVRAWLRGRAGGPVTIKKRGVRTDPDAFRSELRLPRRTVGDDEVILVLTTVAGTPAVLVVDRA
ncbi:THUMP-like domain-containing protein [Serinicoccus kebangsaanensis]|uniref:THUMP-like domain-containing protein n=1 Tax=Serinicoccus kebangsaanensis TaxID=2602069 RepID=UPI00178C65E8|nr:methyltransferase domain-containing protein [Serinicoccus kebangsaanensis]